jgi:ribonuclease-3 family protein
MTDYFHLDMPRDLLLSLSSLGLAHLGDSVFEVMVRS